ncbi:hypothetical protein ACQQ2Q_20530 [Agrobacterium sp. ES01]|uniref:hypothetical protein n=1 Tax=Agrobacterium sp. ES01 TaxID=3420714 RepID=UPI003D0A12A4
MAFSIGLRVYQVTIYKENDRSPLMLTSDGAATDANNFLVDFVDSNLNPNDHEDLQRSWFFEKKSTAAVNNIFGYLRYGTYGFESDLIDRKTKKSNYKRKVGDLEEIPLYFHFWTPAKQEFALAAFQSFQARSCVQVVINAATATFAKRHKGYRISFRKLMPGDVKSSVMYSSPVKQLTLIKKQVPQNKEDRYLFDFKPDEVEFEISFKAKRKRTLGSLASILDKSSDNAAQALRFDGIDFDQAKAEVTVGNKRRTVGILGYSNDAGVIELSESVQYGSDGHPSFASIKYETEQILKDFQTTLSKPKK